MVSTSLDLAKQVHYEIEVKTFFSCHELIQLTPSCERIRIASWKTFLPISIGFGRCMKFSILSLDKRSTKYDESFPWSFTFILLPRLIFDLKNVNCIWGIDVFARTSPNPQNLDGRELDHKPFKGEAAEL